jgi:hypothetical protein
MSSTEYNTSLAWNCHAKKQLDQAYLLKNDAITSRTFQVDFQLLNQTINFADDFACDPYIFKHHAGNALLFTVDNSLQCGMSQGKPFLGNPIIPNPKWKNGFPRQCGKTMHHQLFENNTKLSD